MTHTRPEIYPTSLDLDDARQMWRDHVRNRDFINRTRVGVIVTLAITLLTVWRIHSSTGQGGQVWTPLLVVFFVLAAVTVGLAMALQGAIRKDENTMHELASGLSGLDYERVTGQAHPWAISINEGNRQ